MIRAEERQKICSALAEQKARGLRIRHVKPTASLEDSDGRKRSNGFQLAKAARRARREREIRRHIREVHAGEDVAPLKLGSTIYSEEDAPDYCEVCGEAFTP